MLKIDIQNLRKITNAFLEEGKAVYAPRPLGMGDFAFDRIENHEDFQIEGFVNTLLPPKEIFFRQMETIGRFGWKKKGLCEDVEPEIEDKVLLGIRPCDLEGLLLIDAFYDRVGADMPYKRRRGKTFIIAYACPEPADTCFCVETDSGPWAKRGFDWQLHWLDEGIYLLEVGSEKGKDMAERFADLMEKAGEDDLKLLEARRKETLGKFKDRPYVKKGIGNITKVGGEVYRYLGERCFRCGGCNYLCPTCTCYNVADIGAREGERVLFWDSCQFEGYSRLAGNLNPRPDQGSRLKFRFECKLAEWNVETYGRIRCTGCGRCIYTCIGDADIDLFLKKASET